MKSVGYALAIPPRTGTWQIDPSLSHMELCVRELYRTSVLEAPIVEGAIHLTGHASASRLRLQLGAAFDRRASVRATEWMRSAGLDSAGQPPRFDSRVMLAAPQGLRMSGQLCAERLNATLMADARIHGVHTHPDGHDAMAMTATGAITRTRTLTFREALFRSPVVIRIHAYLVHD